MSFYISCCVVFTILVNVNTVGGESNEISVSYEYMTLNPGQRLYFNKFKTEVKQNLVITKDYMLKDMYLLKWLKATEFKVPDAVAKFKKMLEWRKEYKMDTILDEDFSDFVREFPFTMDSVDLIGRPVGCADISDWNIRRVVLMGKRDKAIRFVSRMAEFGVMKVMEQHEKFPNVSSGILLLNLKGFNTVEHGCPECIPVCRNLVVSLESYFPFMIYRFIGINTPMQFYSVFNAFAPLMKKHVRSVIRIFGMDKRKWKAEILSLISPDQLETEFGGTRKSKHDQ